MSLFGQRVRRFLQKPGTADLSRYQRLLPGIAAREAGLRQLPDAALAGLAAAAQDGAGFCAVGREAARRALGERPYDVQLLGALVMLSGHVAEMATGEGKTLSGALAAAAYAVGGRTDCRPPSRRRNPWPPARPARSWTPLRSRPWSGATRGSAA